MKSEDEPRKFRVKHCWNQLEYWEESLWFEGTCCHSDSSEIQSASDGRKLHDSDKNNNDNNNTQRSSKLRLYRERDETIVHVVSECSKLAQKEYKAKYNRVEGVPLEKS